jgi:hypothetical protein
VALTLIAQTNAMAKACKVGFKIFIGVVLVERLVKVTEVFFMFMIPRFYLLNRPFPIGIYNKDGKNRPNHQLVSFMYRLTDF